MVKPLLLSSLILIAGCSTAQLPAINALEDPGAPPLQALTLPTISNLSVTHNAVRASGERNAEVDCSNFQLDAAGVQRFLAHSQTVQPFDYWHSLDWSACHAGGTVTFVDGRTAVWSLHQYRAGSLLFENGEEVFLYCPECRWKPFIW